MSGIDLPRYTQKSAVKNFVCYDIDTKWSHTRLRVLGMLDASITCAW